MAQNNTRWTAPTFSFDSADLPNAWTEFYLSTTDYLEVLRIKPEEEDQEKRGWEQITTMFTGENRQILQTLIHNNKITETDQRTPILALKAIETAIENKEHHRTSTTMATKSATTSKKSSTKCPWRQFHKCIIKYMDSLHTEQCEPQMKIDIFVNAIRNTFFQQNEKSTKLTQTTEQPMMTLDASTTMDLEQKSTKQTQTTEQPMMTLGPSSSTKHRTSNSDTDSAYNTDTEHLPRPPHNKNQPKPGTSTWSNTQTTVKQPTRTPAASTYPQHTRKTPLLPTPPAPERNHYNQHISGPSASRHNIYSAFSRPSPVIPRPYYRAHQQHHIPRPSPFHNRVNHQPILTRPYQQHQQTPGQFFTRPFHHQPLLLLPAFTGPYPQIQGHFPQQVYYLPVILQHPIQQYII